MSKRSLSDIDLLLLQLAEAREKIESLAVERDKFRACGPVEVVHDLTYRILLNGIEVGEYIDKDAAESIARRVRETCTLKEEKEKA